MRSIRLSLAAGPRAPAEARTGLFPLAGEIPPATFEMLRLLVSELVTNSVRHARLGEAGRVVLS
ncbi:MAG: hypothetical protein ACRDJF_06765, partial [Actinomycetota bacterium]